MDFDLRPLLRTENPEERKRLMERLFSAQIEPIVKQTIRVKFRSLTATKHDEEDIFSETLLKLWKQLQKWLQFPDQMQVSDFSAYVAATTLNCCREYFRSKFPRRWHLRNRLRYLLSHSDEFTIWKSKTGEWITGFSGSKDSAPMKSERLAKLIEHSEIQSSARQPQAKLFEIAGTIFRHSQTPVLLDDLLTVVLALPGFREQFQDIQMQNDPEMDSLADPRSHLKIATQKSDYLGRLWSEICGLPLKQRLALLLNLRDHDGREAITSFPATGTASISQIAVALEMAPEELAELWSDLPMDDSRIADRLKLTRQQVVNLRKSARERLSYRMKGGTVI
jgi:DNA-directed RNA polymerase specialized sigma24 family protein